jgi:hypothetical protein
MSTWAQPFFPRWESLSGLERGKNEGPAAA